MKKTYKYTGAGDYLEGVPARDLTQDEWDRLPADLKETAVQLGLYEAPKKGLSTPEAEKTT